jgi:hypothetical protein
VIGITKILGWAANILLAAMLIDGYWHLFDTGSHFRWGLGVVLYLPLVYLLPYFHLIGVASRLKQEAKSDDESATATFRLAVQLKNRLFWPVVIAVIMCIAGPVLGFLQTGGLIPAHVHGIYMLVYCAVHVVTWVRILFVLGLSAELSALDSSY